MSSDRKKERQRLKRKKKQLALRKVKNQSIYQHLARSQPSMRCDVNEDWREAGQAAISIVCESRGQWVMLVFLVDLWCVGLKDAYGQVGIAFDLYEEKLANGRGRSVRMPIETARRLIAGAVRFSRQNGFKLPHRWERYVAAIGVRDTEHADLSDFGGPDGKLRFMGSIEGLRHYLIGSVEDFLQRPDVEFFIGPDSFSSAPAFTDDDEWEDEDEEEEGFEETDEDERPGLSFSQFKESVIATRNVLARHISDWLIEQGRTPDPHLNDALEVAMAMAMTGKDGVNIVEEIVATHPMGKSLADGLEQVKDYMLHHDPNKPMPVQEPRAELDAVSEAADNGPVG